PVHEGYLDSLAEIRALVDEMEFQAVFETQRDLYAVESNKGSGVQAGNVERVHETMLPGAQHDCYIRERRSSRSPAMRRPNPLTDTAPSLPASAAPARTAPTPQSSAETRPIPARDPAPSCT